MPTAALFRCAPIALTLLLAACGTPHAKPGATTDLRTASTTPLPSPLPASVDLRPRLTELGLTPRPQGARGTCSIFTTCEAIEFAHARRTGKATRLSPEFVNWAGAEASGGPSDGNFFHNALAGFEKRGVCAETQMPYSKNYDANRKPSAEALAEAERIRDESRGTIRVHWIVPWQSARFGVGDEQFAEIKRVIASGYPVAAGSGHSRLLVGYEDNDKAAGGGLFITEDSALNRFAQVTYEFVRKDVADVFWVEAVEPTAAASKR
jgi:C1A family cysteine protease